MGIVIFLFTDAVLDFLMTAARNRSKFTLMGLKPPSPRASTSPAPDFSRPSICGERSQRQSALAESSRGKLRARLLRFIAPGNVRAALSDTPRFRPFYQVEGHDADFTALPVEEDLDLLLENLPTTRVLKFCITAGDSPKGEVAEITLA